MSWRAAQLPTAARVSDDVGQYVTDGAGHDRVAEVKPLGDAADLPRHVRRRHGGDDWGHCVQRVDLPFRVA